uniref:Uncharacterized protein n=1 Tax=Anopheles coluzzii TaxID=1518534 RepID=A0A8W7PII0_ANOCL
LIFPFNLAYLLTLLLPDRSSMPPLRYCCASPVFPSPSFVRSASSCSSASSCRCCCTTSRFRLRNGLLRSTISLRSRSMSVSSFVPPSTTPSCSTIFPPPSSRVILNFGNNRLADSAGSRCASSSPNGGTGSSAVLATTIVESAYVGSAGSRTGLEGSTGSSFHSSFRLLVGASRSASFPWLPTVKSSGTSESSSSGGSGSGASSPPNVSSLSTSITAVASVAHGSSFCSARFSSAFSLSPFGRAAFRKSITGIGTGMGSGSGMMMGYGTRIVTGGAAPPNPSRFGRGGRLPAGPPRGPPASGLGGGPIGGGGGGAGGGCAFGRFGSPAGNRSWAGLSGKKGARNRFNGGGRNWGGIFNTAPPGGGGGGGPSGPPVRSRPSYPAPSGGPSFGARFTTEPCTFFCKILKSCTLGGGFCGTVPGPPPVSRLLFGMVTLLLLFMLLLAPPLPPYSAWCVTVDRFPDDIEAFVPAGGLWPVRRLRELFGLGRVGSVLGWSDLDSSFDAGATDMSGFLAGVGDRSSTGEGSGDERTGSEGTGDTDSDRSDTGDIEQLLQFFIHSSGVMRVPKIDTHKNKINNRTLKRSY